MELEHWELIISASINENLSIREDIHDEENFSTTIVSAEDYNDFQQSIGVFLVKVASQSDVDHALLYELIIRLGMRGSRRFVRFWVASAWLIFLPSRWINFLNPQVAFDLHISIYRI